MLYCYQQNLGHIYLQKYFIVIFSIGKHIDIPAKIHSINGLKSRVLKLTF